ncbi:protein arginine kinase [Pullulanibacillus pueri]|uniref:Protein-arginine kinase n=1 Tax=Pullulanibacillus pueri TaxID=1437324 RepID=A0A8J2ZY77_9BACL|nr:protein arginine kinase [Pullulanibacillus pueri]MBM7683167.1 protein arginine kinase [Pullulanibacillus pueri]GGH85481.1 protein-arginine kinase [Pullulanibacillus pueri]
MSLRNFIDKAVSPWMQADGPDSDIVLSSRIRLARNLSEFAFPVIASKQQSEKALEHIKTRIKDQSYHTLGKFEWIQMDELEPIEKRVLVEKHLISPYLDKDSKYSAVLINESESVSIMVNEEDHLRIQCLFPGFQLNEALTLANGIDDWIEEKFNYAFDETRGYLTSCPTNVGTGLRASVMVHLPALMITQRMNRIAPAINQFGLAVRGIYGEGSEALGNVFQISNQITLGKSEEDIVEDLRGVVMQLINQEKAARKDLLKMSKVQLEDRVYRSYGILANSRIIHSKEAAKCLSDVRLGIDLELIDELPKTILNELMVLTQPGFLQHYFRESLTPDERDIRRATLIRERIQLENSDQSTD